MGIAREGRLWQPFKMARNKLGYPLPCSMRDSKPPRSMACCRIDQNDSVFSPFVAGDLGMRLNFYMDVFGGGSSTESLIGIAIGVIEADMCRRYRG